MLAVVAPSIYGRSTSALKRVTTCGGRSLETGLLQRYYYNEGGGGRGGGTTAGGDRPPLLALWNTLQTRSQITPGLAAAAQRNQHLSSSSSSSGSGGSDGEASPGSAGEEGSLVVEGGEGSAEDAARQGGGAAAESGGGNGANGGNDDGSSKGGKTLLDRLNPFKRSSAAATKRDSKEGAVVFAEQEGGVVEKDANNNAAERDVTAAAAAEKKPENDSVEADGGERDGGAESPRPAEAEAVVSAAMVPSSPRPENFPQVVAVRLTKRPLFPGFYVPFSTKDQKLAARLMELRTRGTPWVGTFLMKDAGTKSKDLVAFPGSDGQSKDGDDLHGEELYKSLHEYGTFAQVLWSVLDSIRVIAGLINFKQTPRV